MNQLLTEQIAYFAGLFDGEGSVSVVRHNTGYHVLVQITMLDNPVILDMADMLGGRVNYHRAASGKRTVRGVWNGRNAGAMLRVIRPYLRIKARQADLALEFQEKKTAAGFGKFNHPDDCETYRQRLIDLNQGKCHLPSSAQAV